MQRSAAASDAEDLIKKLQELIQAVAATEMAMASAGPHGSSTATSKYCIAPEQVLSLAKSVCDQVGQMMSLTKEDFTGTFTLPVYEASAGTGPQHTCNSGSVLTGGFAEELLYIVEELCAILQSVEDNRAHKGTLAAARTAAGRSERRGLRAFAASCYDWAQRLLDKKLHLDLNTGSKYLETRLLDIAVLATLVMSCMDVLRLRAPLPPLDPAGLAHQQPGPSSAGPSTAAAAVQNAAGEGCMRACSTFAAAATCPAALAGGLASGALDVAASPAAAAASSASSTQQHAAPCAAVPSTSSPAHATPAGSSGSSFFAESAKGDYQRGLAGDYRDPAGAIQQDNFVGKVKAATHALPNNTVTVADQSKDVRGLTQTYRDPAGAIQQDNATCGFQ